MRPADGRTNPQTALKRVVFPAPLGPMIPTTSRGRMSRDTESSATRPPKRTVTSSTSRPDRSVTAAFTRAPPSPAVEIPTARPERFYGGDLRNPGTVVNEQERGRGRPLRQERPLGVGLRRGRAQAAMPPSLNAPGKHGLPE